MADNDGSASAGTPSDQSWIEGFDDAAKQHIANKGYGSPADVVQAHMHLESKIGDQRLSVPKAGEELANWEGWSERGGPEEASAYELAAPEGFEGYDDGLSDWFRAAAHEIKMPASMAQAMHDKFVERMGEQYTAKANSDDEAMHKRQEDLKKEYGAAFDERIALADKAGRTFFGEEFFDLLYQHGLSANPVVMNGLVKAGMEISTPGFKDGAGNRNFAQTPATAKEEISRLRANPALYDKHHAEYKMLNDRLTELHGIAHPENVGAT